MGIAHILWPMTPPPAYAATSPRMNEGRRRWGQLFLDTGLDHIGAVESPNGQ
jgi:hypothetical protein